MSYHIAHHRLLSDHVQHESIEKHSGQFARGLPDTVVLHFSGTGTLQSAINTMLDPEVKASVHLIIGRNGNVVQLLPFDRIAWHAGVSEYQGRKDLNRYSIGIELENAGRLTKAGDQYVSWFGRTYGEDDVVQAAHANEAEPSFWHRYSEAQISAVLDVCRVLCRDYGITNILGHDEISPQRKVDPGPAFPLDIVRERLLYNDRQEGVDQFSQISSQGVVYHQPASFFSQPDASSPLVEAGLLSEGTEMNVTGEQNGWYRVSIPVSGWVQKENIKLDGQQLLVQQVIDV
ncbi:MAG: N-acetylmuramoyl-L-alanine amidase [Pseudomonadales bacterium]|nr:N-acetylmuramoyl-L-alanine amidase [Pseudomonadales bacterium]